MMQRLHEIISPFLSKELKENCILAYLSKNKNQ